MELMASESSALLVLSMQFVSTQQYLRLCSRVRAHAPKIFLYPALLVSGPSIHSWKSTSFSPHVWDKMAYGGSLTSRKDSILSVSALMSRMALTEEYVGL